MQDSILR